MTQPVWLKSHLQVVESSHKISQDLPSKARSDWKKRSKCFWNVLEFSTHPKTDPSYGAFGPFVPTPPRPPALGNRCVLPLGSRAMRASGIAPMAMGTEHARPLKPLAAVFDCGTERNCRTWTGSLGAQNTQRTAKHNPPLTDDI